MVSLGAAQEQGVEFCVGQYASARTFRSGDEVKLGSNCLLQLVKHFPENETPTNPSEVLQHTSLGVQL